MSILLTVGVGGIKVKIMLPQLKAKLSNIKADMRKVIKVIKVANQNKGISIDYILFVVNKLG